MSYRSREAVHQGATISPVPPVVRTPHAERTFGLHPVLFAGTIGAYFAFLGIMAAAFMVPALAIPFVIFAVYVVMAFGVPAMWARVAPGEKGRAQNWSEFQSEGMAIETGHIESGAAIAQVLVLPGLLVLWAAAIAIIAALV